MSRKETALVATALEDEGFDPTEHVPTELLADPSNPANHEFYRNTAMIQRHVRAAKAKLTAKQRDAAIMIDSRKSVSETAKTINVSPNTIYRWVKTAPFKEFLAARAYLRALQEAPRAALRMNMLYRIAINNTDKAPKTAIAAIKEINLMTGAYPDTSANPNNPFAKGGTVNIIINGVQAGPLDAPADTYETRSVQNPPLDVTPQPGDE